ncbi:MAG: T9SS type A sorting domain-containing protein [bacterium]
MKLKLYAILVLFTSVLMSSTYAQKEIKILKQFNKTDSINVDPYSFYPMQVGNFWQYAFINEIVGEDLVVKDSILENGSKLYWMNSGLGYLIDTNYNVFGWHPSGQIQNMYLLYKLNAELGQEWTMWQYDPTFYTIIGKVENVYLAEYLSVVTIFKEIVEYTRDSIYGDLLRHKYLLGAGLGVVTKRNDSMVEPPEYLYSAIINGDTLGTIVGVQPELENLQPNSPELLQNYPNPFNPSTTISYVLNKPGLTKLEIYNLLGEKIKTVVNLFQSAGSYSYNIDMSEQPSGIYMYTLIFNNIMSVKKMIYLK